MREGVTTMDVRDVQERWLDNKDAWDEKEREEWAEQSRIEEQKRKAAKDQDEDDDMEGMSLPPGGSGIKIIRTDKT
jgi:hypothetical protein